MREEKESSLLRLNRQKDTLLERFFSMQGRQGGDLKYFGLKVAVRDGRSILTADQERVATFDGHVLKILRLPTPLEYVADVCDLIVQEGCRLFHGDEGFRTAKRLNARFAHRWYTLSWDHSATDAMLPYPFVIDVVNLKIHLPPTFFLVFLRHTTSERSYYRMMARYHILHRLHDLIDLPGQYLEPVRMKMLEVKLDEAAT